MTTSFALHLFLTWTSRLKPGARLTSSMARLLRSPRRDSSEGSWSSKIKQPVEASYTLFVYRITSIWVHGPGDLLYLYITPKRKCTVTCTHTHAGARTRTRTHARTRARTHACTHASTYARAPARPHARTPARPATTTTVPLVLLVY